MRKPDGGFAIFSRKNFLIANTPAGNQCSSVPVCSLSLKSKLSREASVLALADVLHTTRHHIATYGGFQASDILIF